MGQDLEASMAAVKPCICSPIALMYTLYAGRGNSLGDAGLAGLASGTSWRNRANHPCIKAGADRHVQDNHRRCVSPPYIDNVSSALVAAVISMSTAVLS